MSLAPRPVTTGELDSVRKILIQAGLNPSSATAKEIAQVVEVKGRRARTYQEKLRVRDLTDKACVTKQVLVIPDLQIPYQDNRSLAAVHAFMKDHVWDEIVCLGDFLDFNSISSHSKTDLLALTSSTLDEDYAEGNKVLDTWQEAAPNAKITLIEGNHEYRVQNFLKAIPQLRGKIEVPYGLKLKERGIGWVPFWSDNRCTYDIGKATFIHGKSTNCFHSKAMAYMYGRNIFYGHTHDIQGYSVQTAGNDNTYVGQSLGCLCDYQQGYMRGGPSKWQQCFAVFNFFDDGNFTYNVVRIFKNRFFYQGKTYQG